MRKLVISCGAPLLLAALVSGCASKKQQEESITVDPPAPPATAAPADGTVTAAGDATTTATADADTAGPATADGGQGALVSRGNTLYFAFDSTRLTPSAIAVLREQAKRLKKTGQAVVLEGHCDERGTPEYNLALGERRAQAVRSLLVTLGADTARLDATSYGEMKPAATGHDESAWAQNRRVEIRVKAK